MRLMFLNKKAGVEAGGRLYFLKALIIYGPG